MYLKKIFYNSFLALKNINRYGFFVILKSMIYEIFYSIKFNDYSFFKYDSADNIGRTYDDSKTIDSYTTPNIPTPYFFLHLIKNFLIDQKIDSFNFIDLGCGSGRLAKYFDSKFDIRFTGVDINKKFIEENIKNFKRGNITFHTLDLKNINEVKDLDIIDKNFLKYKKNIIFISDSIDAKSILKIIPFLTNKFNEFLFIMVNQKNNDLFNKYICIKRIFFKDESRNIIFFQI